MIINVVDPNRMTRLFFAVLASIDVIKDFSVCFILISFSDEKILNKDGINVKVTSKETIRPKVIIQPKSIIGLMPLNIKDKNAQIVVSAV